MKLFKIIELDESYHVATETQLEAIQFFVKDSESDLQDINSIIEVIESEWESLVIKYNEENEDGTPIEILASELMKDIKTPEIICSSAYL